MKSWLEKNHIEMYSTHDEEKSVIAEISIRTFKNKIYKNMTSGWKNVSHDKLDDIVNKSNNTYHSTIRVKPVDAKSNTYIGSTKEINNKNPKFKIGDIVKVSKYKNYFYKRLQKTFYENELQKINQKEFRVEKEIKRKSNKLYVKWKGYDSSFNSWINKKT